MASAEVIHRYRECTAPSGDIDSYLLDLPLDGARPEVQIKAEIRRPDLVRDGLLVLGEVLASDLRHQASDRADYLAYLLRKGKRATQAVWEAQKAFLAAKYGEATQQEAPLDPLFSVSENGIDLAKRVIKQVTEGPLTLDALSETLRQPRQTIRQALLGELLKGTLVHDSASGLFHYRPLLARPLELDQLRYRDAREEQAHRLLATEDQVQLTRIHDLGLDGAAIDGEVQDRQAHRHYQTSFTLDREGRTVKASCTCADFRRAGLKQGPCPHMIALRLRYARDQAALEQARETAEGRRLIRAETRTLTRRQGETVLSYRISLGERQVLLRWGHDPQALRQQRLLFNRPEEARDAYFARLDGLAKQGFIDASGA